MPDESPATAANVEASAEATIAAAAITLESVNAAIAEESDAAEDRQEELLAEVRKCLSKLETLATSLERGAESPSLQQLLIQAGQIQSSLETVQADLAELRQSSQTPPQDAGDHLGERGERRKAEEGTGLQNVVPPPLNAPELSSESPGKSPDQKSNRSATLPSAKKRYIKI